MPQKDQSEERRLPATRKKIDDARKKGLVPKSKDIVSAVSLALIVGYLLLDLARLQTTVTAMVETGITASFNGLTVGLQQMIPMVRYTTVAILGPLFALVLVGTIATNLVVLRGIPVSAEPVVPRFDRINPVEGFKRLFQLRSFVEFVKSLTKMAVLVLALVIILMLALQGLLDSPACGLLCELDVLHRQLAQLLAVAVILFLLIGILDVWLQRWLFLRDQRMSITEAKRERKELEGDPQIKNRRRRLIRESVIGYLRTGLANATFLICNPGVAAVGLRYKRGETPVPYVVIRGSGRRAEQLVAQAAQLGVPTLDNPALAETLMARARPGSFAPPDTFDAIAKALAQLRLIS